MSGLSDYLTRRRAPLAQELRRRDLSASADSSGAPEIRIARAGDVAALFPLLERTCVLHQAWDAARFGCTADAVRLYGKWLEKLSRDPRGVFLLALTDQVPVGFVVATIEQAPPIYRVSRYGYIRDLWVDQDRRRQGLGRALIETAAQRLVAKGAAQLRLETAAPNAAAREFFARCGFRVATIELLREA